MISRNTSVMLAIKIVAVLCYTLFALGQTPQSALPDTAECNSCIANLASGCSTLLGQSSVEANTKCACTSAFVNNFANCGVCSQQFGGYTDIQIPTDADKAEYIQSCANDGFPIEGVVSSSSTVVTSNTPTSLPQQSQPTNVPTTSPQPKSEGGYSTSVGLIQTCMGMLALGAIAMEHP
ncbi:hypothetical protein K493DRAFT_377428 [Basidiobolus meristosporus CBS 931.73]|uniref:Uncharacterized protein n=1 Tax=Basidiobolus meristosporus CBS 931.73 TaxID=1314790 RepID=A0A1Y1Y2A6_9FUNG|nr:hypothetical protein K493DRAFT_377428 [Basidiobolus meristosporus CBS 931.73]|eukprot:ORX92147.1 hypothetical protein K493DRAFT_377428 [Basidiobolus meristosporus CBS 931.73]